jgi:hypothetical protein
MSVTNKPTNKSSSKRIKMVTIANPKVSYSRNGYRNGYMSITSNERVNLLDDYKDDNEKISAVERLNRLTPSEIKNRLKNFVKVPTDDVDSIPLQTKIQYLDTSDGTSKYRPGGILQYNGGPNYIVLTNINGDRKWSVQLHSATIFREMDLDEIKREYDEQIFVRDKQMDKYRAHIKKQKRVIDVLSSEIKALRKRK